MLTLNTIRSVTLLAGGLLIALAASSHGGEAQSDRYKVSFDEAQGTFSITDKTDGRCFLKDARLPDSAAKADVAPVEDPVWGKGEALQVTLKNGGTVRVLLANGLPFVLIRVTVTNTGAAEASIENVVPFEGALDLGFDAAKLKAVGTAGLTGVGQPGSYAFLAIGDPESRKGVVCGWVSHDRGSGVVFSSLKDGAAMLKAQVDYGDLRVPANGSVETETVAVGRFDDVRFGLEAYAEAIAKCYRIQLPTLPTVYCTWYHAGASDEKRLMENATFAQEQFAPYGFSVMQIDDGWQDGQSNNGPRKNFNTIAPNGPYPSGMKQTAENLKACGLVAGIWFMPFAGTHDDPFFAEKQDLFYQKDGKPYDTRWGGTCMDMTNPKTREYLRALVYRIAKEWGYQYFKMDGMWTGTGAQLLYVNGGYKPDDLGKAKRHDPSMTPIEAYRTGIKLVRETAGKEVFLLGCCAPQNMRSFGGAFGLIDAMRIGPDNGPIFDAMRCGPIFGGRTYFLNRRVWYNDPDPVYVRMSVPYHQAQNLVSWVTLTGQFHASSEDFNKLPPERVDLLRRAMPSHELKSVRPVDYLENDPTRIWILTDERTGVRRDVVGLFNWDKDKPFEVDCPAAKLGLPPAENYVAFDYWGKAFVPPFKERLRAHVPAGACQVLSIRPVSDKPVLLGTSRHITQGSTDLLAEKWDEASGTLSGTSRVVGNDPYEIRIVVPVGEKSWLAEKAELAVAPEGAKATPKQDGPMVRVTIEAPKSGDVKWALRFKRGVVQAAESGKVTDLQFKFGFSSVQLEWKGAAVGYDVTREGGEGTFAVSTLQARAVDSTVKGGTEYRYSVRARTWGGKLSEPVTVTVKTPEAPKRPADPPAPDVFCDDLNPLQATVGWGNFTVGKSAGGKPLTVDGKRHDKGLGVHAESTVVYAVPKGAKWFVATVGLDDSQKGDDRPSVIFRVLGDVKELGETPQVLAETPVLSNASKLRSWAFNVEIPERIKELRLIVAPTPDGIAADHADWVNAGFVTR